VARKLAGEARSRNHFIDGQIMDINRFWQIVDQAHAQASDPDSRVESLRELLDAESLEEIQSFQNHYDEQIRQSYRWDLWGAAYLINGGCSDDGFRYFRDWLISEGSSTFAKALRQPDSLSSLPRIEIAELELFGYVAFKVFRAKGGDEIDRDFSTELSTPAGEEWGEDDLPELLPHLAAQYN
jgi:hypothetical protein